MTSEDTKRSGLNQYKKSDKAPSLIYAHLKCLIENIDGCKNNPENSLTTFKNIENKHDINRGKDL